MTSAALTVSCGFQDCDPSIASRVLLATVDQLCAVADVGMDVLESLEFPLREVFEALGSYSLSDATVSVDRDELQVQLHLGTSVADVSNLLGDCEDVVTSFFDVDIAADAHMVTLTGSLR